VSRLAVRRLLAWGVDWLCILVWVAVVAAVGVPLYLAGATPDLGPVALNLMGAALVVVPVTLALAGMESSRRASTPGKRLLRLEVVSWPDRHRAGFGRALARNTGKIAVPWLLGHAVAFAFATGEGLTLPVLIVLTAVSYAVPILFVVSLFVSDGRTPYDRIVGTLVERTAGEATRTT
jgi:uncharacterized RDD family membrane protein YckC